MQCVCCENHKNEYKEVIELSNIEQWTQSYKVGQLENINMKKCVITKYVKLINYILKSILSLPEGLTIALKELVLINIYPEYNKV